MTNDSRYLARERFRYLLEQDNSSETEWQRLFAECPCILIESLPLRIHEDDIQSLARPGRAEPDFLIFPRKRDPLSPTGLIEIKRPSTRILRIPRQEVLCLSSDAETALAQAQKYAMDSGSQAILRPDELVFVGNNLHLFIIAGMSAEIASKVTTDLLRAQFQRLLPAGVRLIPYDTLLRTFESKFPPQVHVLQTVLPDAIAALDHLLRTVETAYRNYKGYTLSEDVISDWNALEEEYLRIRGSNHETTKYIERIAFEIIESGPDGSGRRPIATEAPNPSMFALRVCALIVQILDAAETVGLQSNLVKDQAILWKGCGAYASD